MRLPSLGLGKGGVAVLRRKQASGERGAAAALEVGKGLRVDLLLAAAREGEGRGADNRQRDGSGTFTHLGLPLAACQSRMKCGLNRDRSCVIRARSSRMPIPAQLAPTIQAPTTGRKPSKIGSG